LIYYLFADKIISHFKSWGSYSPRTGPWNLSFSKGFFIAHKAGVHFVKLFWPLLFLIPTILAILLFGAIMGAIAGFMSTPEILEE